MKIIKKIIAETISARLTPDIPADEICSMLSYPPDPEMGDLSLPCFKFAKQLKKPPVKIAEEFAASLAENLPEAAQSAKAVNGFLNFFINPAVLAQTVLDEVFGRGNRYGSSDIGLGKTAVIDFSSPNIAKPFVISLLLSTVIGNAIRNIYEFCGYKCIAVNYLGDWGTQFGKVITAYLKWCNNMDEVEEKGVFKLTELYVRINAEAEKDPSLAEESRQWFSKLEQGDETARYLWKKFRDISLKEFMKTYDFIGIKFDSYDGESFFNDKMQPVVDELRGSGLLKVDDGASIVDLSEYNMPPCLILRRDGATLYPTRDIASAIYRKEEYDFDLNIYVTDMRQILHFDQWRKVVALMGREWADKCVHVPFGLMSFNGESMGTRKGNMLLLDDIFKMSIEKVSAIIEEKNPDLPEEKKKEISKAVGVGAIIFGDLANSRERDFNFSWEEVLNFDGNSGPYAQYSYARICGVLKKSELDGAEIINRKVNAEPDSMEKELLKLIAQFPEKVLLAARDYEPSVISRYILDLCAAFNRFYNGSRILKAENEQIKIFRLKLCLAVKNVLGAALELIGLERTEVV